MENEGKGKKKFQITTKTGVDVETIWEQVVSFFKSEKKTPYLSITEEQGCSKYEVIDEDTDNGRIYDDDKVVIYPSSFQRWYYENDKDALMNIKEEIDKKGYKNK